MSKKIGKIISLLLALALTVTSVFSGITSKQVMAATANTIELLSGENKTVEYTSRWSVSSQTVTSSNSKVATAKLNGKEVTITGVGEGTATITVNYKYQPIVGNAVTTSTSYVVNVVKHAKGEALEHLFVSYEGTFSLVKDGKEIAKVKLEKKNFDANKVGFTAAYADGTPVDFKITDKEKLKDGYIVYGTMYKGTQNDPIYYTLTYPVTYKIGKDSYTATLRQTINYFEKENICTSSPRGIDFKLNVKQNISTHTVKFMNENKELQTVTVDHGTAVAYTGATPTKAEDAVNTYAFDGWVDASGNKANLNFINENTVVYASFKATAKNYTVEFVDANGNTISKDTTYKYGDTITAPTVDSYSDDVFDYDFDKWTPNFSATVTGNAKYTAVMNKTNRFYNVSFVVNGETISNDYAAGTKATDIEVPVVADIITNEKTYKFLGWDNEISDVTADVTYTAQFDQGTDRTYTVKFVQPNGAEISNATYGYNDTITVPKNPSYNGEKGIYTYSFAGWDKTVSDKCVGDVTYVATYDKSIKVSLYKYNEAVDTKDDFFDMDEVAGRDASYFTTIGNKVTIKEKDFNNYAELISVLEDVYKNSTTSKKGTNGAAKVNRIVDLVAALAGTTTDVVDCFYVVKLESDGWHVDGGNFKDYTVVFTDENGTVISSKENYHYGDAVEVPTAPTKESDATYTYTFAGWTPEVTDTVTGNAAYVATFDAEYINYTIEFVDEDGSDILTKTDYHYGDRVVFPANPTKESNATYTYTFAGWDKTVSRNVVGNAKYTATYTSEFINYTVEFVDYNGTVISSKEDYHFGDRVEVPANPSREADNNNTYTFVGWDKEVTNVEGNVTYIANYSSTAIDYVIDFVDEDGTVISHQVLNYGDTVVIPEDPTKESDATYTYEFAGWDKDVAETVVGDAKYTATYTSEYINYTVEFVDYDGTVISSKNDYHYGDAIEVPTDVTRESDEVNNYTFTGWNNEVPKAVTENLQFIAEYEAEKIVYVITFVDDDNTVIAQYELNYGDTVVSPQAPTKETVNNVIKTFAGWSSVIESVTGNATYVATYTTMVIKTPEVEADEDEISDVIDGSVTPVEDETTAPEEVIIETEDKNHSDEINTTVPDKKGEVEADEDVLTGFVNTGIYVALLGLGAVAITALFAKKKTQKEN